MQATPFSRLRRVFLRLAPACALILLLTGCAELYSPGETRDIQYELNQVKLSLSRLNESQNAAFRQLQFDIEQMNKTLKQESKTEAQRMTELENRMAALEERIATLSGGDTAMNANSDSGDENALATPQQDQLLQDAQSAYARGEYDKSIELYSEFLQKYPEAPGAADAAYYLALSYYAKKEYNRARRALDHVLKTYPASSILPQTLHSRALCEYQLREYDEARETLKRLQTEYPEYEPERIEAILKEIP